MATKSILKNVTVRSNSAGSRLARAIEKAEKSSKAAPKQMRKRVDLVTDPETIRKMFEG
ncbi:MAG: hypothetical protein IJX93_06550 [Clostridia bacterium]|nr:hypothetical protein [Clostridia bacterium]MBQ8333415.1 hypothetical protein [Clostridia bacterium]MBQ8368401.1 hypothetical protein [Clostridia bacterium]MBQ8511260.1 hypothetical protein [Clostridia bacterium]